MSNETGDIPIPQFEACGSVRDVHCQLCLMVEHERRPRLPCGPRHIPLSTMSGASLGLLRTRFFCHHVKFRRLRSLVQGGLGEHVPLLIFYMPPWSSAGNSVFWWARHSGEAPDIETSLLARRSLGEIEGSTANTMRHVAPSFVKILPFSALASLYHCERVVKAMTQSSRRRKQSQKSTSAAQDPPNVALHSRAFFFLFFPFTGLLSYI